jgi:hypothetical protein
MIDQYLNDLKESIVYANGHREAAAKGNAAIYGMMSRIPFRGMVEKSLKKIMEEMYGGDAKKETDLNEKKEMAIAKNPAWMRVVNRFLSAWSRWKR